MEKEARKKLEAHLITSLIAELKKQNEIATKTINKHIKEAAKSLSKKFAKANKALIKAKEAAKPRTPIAIKKVTRKAIPKAPAKAVKRKR